MKRQNTLTAAAAIAGLGLTLPVVGPAQAAEPSTVCSDVSVSAATVPGSAGAGSYTETITVTNTGTTECDVGGHPGVQRANVSETGVTTEGAPAAWTAEHYVPVYLAPGDSAVAELRVTRAENYDPALCGALVPTNALNVYLPGSTEVVTVGSTAVACTSSDLVTSTVGVFTR